MYLRSLGSILITLEQTDFSEGDSLFDHFLLRVAARESCFAVALWFSDKAHGGSAPGLRIYLSVCPWTNL